MRWCVAWPICNTYVEQRGEEFWLSDDNKSYTETWQGQIGACSDKQVKLHLYSYMRALVLLYSCRGSKSVITLCSTPLRKLSTRVFLHCGTENSLEARPCVWLRRTSFLSTLQLANGVKTLKQVIVLWLAVSGNSG